MQLRQLLQLVVQRRRVLRRKKLRLEQLLGRVPLLGSEELCGIGGTPRKIHKRVWRTPHSRVESISLSSQNTLQKKVLTSRYLPCLVDLFTSTPGLGPRLFRLPEGFGEFGKLGRSLLLQTLALEDGIL